MKIQDQVVSLELAKKRKALGVRQVSHFVWAHDEAPKIADFAHPKDIEDRRDSAPYISTNYGAVGVRTERIAAAFTSAELGQMMKGFLIMTFPEQPETGRWEVDLEDAHEELAYTEADARGGRRCGKAEALPCGKTIGEAGVLPCRRRTVRRHA